MASICLGLIVSMLLLQQWIILLKLYDHARLYTWYISRCPLRSLDTMIKLDLSFHYIWVMYSTDREDISLPHFITIIKSEVSHFYFIVLLFRGCLSAVVVTPVNPLPLASAGPTGRPRVRSGYCGRTMIFYVKLIGYIIAPLSHALVDTLHYLVAVVVQLFKALK